VVRGASGPGRGSASGGHGLAAEQWAARRQLYLDNLKVVLIAAIIAAHGIVGYSKLGLWSYADVREVTLSPVTEAVALAVAAPVRAVFDPIAVPGRRAAHPGVAGAQGRRNVCAGPAAAAGVPFAVFTFGVWPVIRPIW
jgi:hypothetical protein